MQHFTASGRPTRSASSGAHRCSVWLAVWIVAVATGSGCATSSASDSLSDSSGSFSDALSSPFKSSSDSSGDDVAYRGDVEAYTLAFLESGSRDGESFQRGLGRVALEHGIGDWQLAEGTLLAVGAALREAGLARPEALAWAQTWLGSAALGPVEAGYRGQAG